MLIYCKYILAPTLFTLPNAIHFVFLYNRPKILIYLRNYYNAYKPQTYLFEGQKFGTPYDAI